MPIWNATVANLTLMALGSSAPEILLSVIGTVTELKPVYAEIKPPSDLGPATIVGSAAFNLLVISALSIIAVDDGEPKAIADTGVFAITNICSLWAYIWLYLTLKESSENQVETWEAVLTFLFFVMLITLSYGADRLNQYMLGKQKSQVEKDDAENEIKVNIYKSQLRKIA